jgi:hypothetical protein
MSYTPVWELSNYIELLIHYGNVGWDEVPAIGRGRPIPTGSR